MKFLESAYEQYLKFIKNYRKYFDNEADYECFCSAAIKKICSNIHGYDENRGSMNAFINFLIKSEFHTFTSKHRVECVDYEDEGVLLENVKSDYDTHDLVHKRIVLKEIMDRAENEINERDWSIFKDYLITDSFADTAKNFNLTRQRIEQICKKVIRKLKYYGKFYS